MEALVLALQIATYADAKDWLLVSLLGVVAALCLAAWRGILGRIKTLSDRLDGKIREDQEGYQRLARCEERLADLMGRRGSVR
jgi:hypothetical protein